MAEETVPPQNPPPSPPMYLEVYCKTSRRTRRFAAGTNAGCAVSAINRKLKRSNAHALHIEAVKEGEEPITFGTNSVLVDYGDGWKLQTFNEADAEYVHWKDDFRPMPMPMPSPVSDDDSRPRMKVSRPISFLYIVKIVFAFILLFVLGAIFTLALENLPAIILYFSSLT